MTFRNDRNQDMKRSAVIDIGANRCISVGSHQACKGYFFMRFLRLISDHGIYINYFNYEGLIGDILNHKAVLLSQNLHLKKKSAQDIEISQSLRIKKQCKRTV